MSDLERLSAELGRVGIRGRLRDRILTEAADHLAEGEPARFGDPAELAQQFADELGTATARRSALRAFAALALAGAAYAIVGASLGRPDVAGAPEPALGVLATVGAIVLPQISFVAGSLAALLAWRRRSEAVLAAADVRLLLRRTVAVLTAAAATVRAARVRTQAAGVAGDVFDDLGPLVPRRYRGRPWAFAGAVAASAGAIVLLAGVAQSDPFDGALRAGAEALACLAGFWALGKPLGLRR